LDFILLKYSPLSLPGIIRFLRFGLSSRKTTEEGACSEHLGGAAEGGEEGIDVGLGVVEGEGDADGAGDAEALHEGLGTMVAGADGDALMVEQDADIGGVGVAEVEGDERRRLAVDMDIGEGAEAVEGAADERLLVGGNGGEAEGTDVVEGAGGSDGAYIVGGAGFELVGELVPRGAAEADVPYHLAAALVGGHLLKPAFAAVEDADTRRAIDLVGAESVEVAAEGLHIDGDMGGTLGAVDGNGDAVGMGKTDDVLDGVDGAEDVADVGDADEAGAGGEEVLEGLHVETAVVGDGDDAEHRAAALAEELPRDDVAVVLHLADNDFVALVAEGFAERGGEEVDALGGAAGEEDFGGGGGAEEAADGLAGGFVAVGGLLRETVDAAVDVGVDGGVSVGDGIDDAARLLRGGGIVEIDQRAAIHLAGEEGKVGSYFCNIIHGLQLR